MYNSDLAINTKEDDLLGRAPFAAQLASAILRNSGNDSMVIGLYGSWGCGKTSLVNMVLEAIKSITQNDDDKPLFVNFMPWNFSTHENLISAYFATIRSSLELKENIKWKDSIGSFLEDYADAWDALNFVPFAGPFLAIGAKGTSRFFGKKLKEHKPIESARRKIEKELQEKNQKIVVVIDDIDRLDNSQIRDIFKLVKQVASFPNTTYLLPMDRDVVARALEKVQDFDGYAYLEKIVQIPFIIPELSTSRTQKILFEKLYAILSEYGEFKLENNYWSMVFNSCVWPFIRNLRDINRLANTLEFKLSVISGEVNLEDIIAITTIDVLQPVLYQWIADNKSTLCGEDDHHFLKRDRKPQELRTICEEDMKRHGIEDIDIAIRAVATLFPAFASEIQERIYGYSESDLRKKMCLAESDRFDLYFQLDKDDLKISRSTILASIRQYSEEEYNLFLDQINTDGTILYYLDELQALINEVPDKRIPLITIALWKRQVDFKGTEYKTIFPISASLKVGLIIEKLMDQLVTNEERFNIIKQVILDADVNALEGIGIEIKRIELAYGRLSGKDIKKEDQIIDEKQLMELEKIYAERIYYIALSDELFQGNTIRMVMYLWNCFDPEKCNEYMQKVCDSSKQTLKYISRMAGQWSGTLGSGWSFYKKDYEKYISEDVVNNIIEVYDKKQLVKDFDTEELIKIASFYMNRGKDEMDYVTIEKATHQIDEWRR